MAAAPSPTKHLEDLLVKINRDKYTSALGGDSQRLPLTTTPVRPFKAADDMAATDSMLQFTLREALPRVLNGLMGWAIGGPGGAAAAIGGGEVLKAVHGKSRQVDEMLDAANYIPQLGWGAALPFAMAKGEGLSEGKLQEAIWGAYGSDWLTKLGKTSARAGASADDLIASSLAGAVEAKPDKIAAAVAAVKAAGETVTHETVARELIKAHMWDAVKKELDYEKRFTGMQVGAEGEDAVDIAELAQKSATLADDAAPIMKPESAKMAEESAKEAAAIQSEQAAVEVAAKLKNLPPHQAKALSIKLANPTATGKDVAAALSEAKGGTPLSSVRANELLREAIGEAKFREQAKSEHPTFVDVNAAGFKKNMLMGYGEGTIRRAISEAPLSQLEQQAAHQFFFGSGYTTSHNIDRKLKAVGVTQSAKERVAEWLQRQR